MRHICPSYLLGLKTLPCLHDLARVKGANGLLVNGGHCLAAGEPWLHHAGLVDGFGRWRLGLDCWCWVVPRAESASALSSASPSSTATLSSGRLLLLLPCGLGWRVLADTLGMPRYEAPSADDRLEARLGVRHAVRD